MGLPTGCGSYTDNNGSAMGEWKARQADRPMQGLKTEVAMLRDEVALLREKIGDKQMADALTRQEQTRSRV